MRMRRFATVAISLAATTLIIFGILPGPIQASAPTTSAAQPLAALTAPASVKEIAKVVLPETSVNAPGFFSYVNQPYTGSVIAWAGTDPAHRINVMTSTDGLTYGNKLTLGESTINRPTVVQMSKAAGGAVILAWRGMDPNHSLNILFNVYGSRQKLTLADNSFTSPAIAIFNGNALLAWTGTDTNHSLNVRPIYLAPLRAGPKTILSQFSSDAWPNLTNRGSMIVLSWSTRTTHLNLADSSDGKTFTSSLGGGLLQLSNFGTDYMNFQTEGGPEDWIAWTGTDTIHHLNVQWTTHYPQWPDAASTKTVLPETALGGPMLGFGSGMLIVWTGTDTLHHLNIARLTGF
ncbi:MAG TPA: hypothetical protein VKQ30_06720 [Ktedonobacterales bacterium]|nr:hypothetical protein [Ktedonobacterales bacterium]